MHRKKVVFLFPFVLALVLLTGWLQLVRLDAAAPGNPTEASHNSTLIYLNQMGGTTHSVIVEGSYAYVGTGSRLQIFNIQTPANPVLVGQSMATRGRVVSVQVTGNYAFVLSSGTQDPLNQHPNELYVFDITNPNNPVGVSTTPLAGRPAEITLAGNYAYIAAEPVWNGTTWDAGGLYILDVTNPGVPIVVGQYDGDVRAFDVAVQGNYAYVAAIVTMVSSLVVLDISNPASPTVLNSINLSGIPRGMYLTGNLLYLALSEQGIAAYSLANPTNPSLAGGSDTPSTAYDLVVEGNYAYVADFTGGLRIINVTNPASMSIVGNYNAPGTNATYNVDVSGAYAYVAYSTDGLKTVDVSSPSSPQEVSSYKDVGYVAEVAAANNLLYTIEEAGVNALRVYDATDPFAVTELGAYTGTFSLYDVVISNTHAYLGGGGLRVVDISNSSNPTLIGYLNTGTVYDLEIANAYAYLVRNNNILIADISNPTNLMAMGSLPVSSPHELDIAGSHAFVASSQGMAVVNISNPMSPALVTTYNPYSGAVNALALKGNYAYLAVETEGVYVLDISNPANPLPAGFTSASATNYQEAYISGNDLYVSAGTDGIYVYNLFNPTEPVLSDSYDTAGYTWGTFHTGTRLYTGDNYGGLYIFATSSSPTSTVYLPLLLQQ